MTICFINDRHTFTPHSITYARIAPLTSYIREVSLVYMSNYVHINHIPCRR
jgi:hypothetical protein